jgi:PAS domain S-box-containing protein
MLTISIIGFLSVALIAMAAVLWRQRLFSRQSNRDLRASEKQFRLLAEVSPDALLICRKSIFVYANPAAVALLGTTGLEHIIGKTPFDIVHPDDHATVKALFVSTLQGRSVQLNEVRVVPLDRGMVPVEITATCYEGPDGPATLMVLKDITMRKHAEAASQEMNIALALGMPGIARVNNFGQYLAVNDLYARLIGYEHSSIIGKDWFCIVQPDSLPKAQTAFETMMREGKGELEAVAVREDGSTFWTHILLIKEDDQLGREPGHRCFMRDVTERKREEERIQRSESLLREVIDTDPNFIFIKDRNGRFTLVNKAVAEAYGTTVEALLGKTDADFNNNVDELEQFRLADLTVMDSLQEQVIPEEKITDAQGRLRWLQTVKRPFMIRSGRADYVLGVASDITERKRAETARRVSDDRLKAFVSGVTDYAIVMLDPDGRITTWNTGAEQIKGYKEQEIVGQSMESFYTREQNEAGHPAWLLAQARANGSVRDEGWRVRKDGTEYWASVTITALYDDSKQIQGFAMITRDLTERKISEDMVSQSERRYRTLIDTAGNAIVNFSSDGRVMGWNRAAEYITGWSRAETMGKMFVDFCTMERNKEPLLADIGQALEGAAVRGVEYRFIAQDGHERICSWNLDRLTNEEGKPIGLIAVGEDITVRRQAETAFVEEKELVEFIMRSLPGVVYLFDTAGRFLRWNESLERESGYGSDEITLMHPQDFIAPEDRASVREKIQETFVTGSATLEANLLRRDGTSCPYYFTGHALPIAGKMNLIGVGIDISDRKRVETQLESVNQRLMDMAASLEQVREGEQKRIARDLHDELGHQLTVLKLDTSLLSKLLHSSKGSDRQKVIDVVERLTDQLDTTFSSVRKIARQIRPNLLDRVGLVPALEASVSDFSEHTGIKVSFTPDAGLEELELDDAVSTTFYRVVQEALTNVARHSGATGVEVRLRIEDGGLALEVEDNGKGFDESRYESDRSLGVRGMQERVAMIGGVFSIVGQKGQGTKVSVKTKKGVKVAC